MASLERLQSFKRNRVFYCMAIIALLCTSCADKKNELLRCDTLWSERTDNQKLIGCWCNEKYGLNTGRTAVTKSMKFQTKLCFYSDASMADFFVSYSYINSSDESDQGTRVSVRDGKLSYDSKKYGQVEYPIQIFEDKLIISGKGMMGGDVFKRCQ
jgi:hypothetical protein